MVGERVLYQTVVLSDVAATGTFRRTTRVLPPASPSIPEGVRLAKLAIELRNSSSRRRRYAQDKRGAMLEKLVHALFVMTLSHAHYKSIESVPLLPKKHKSHRLHADIAADAVVHAGNSERHSMEDTNKVRNESCLPPGPTLCNRKCNHDIVELRVLLFSAPSVHGFSRMGSTDAR
jgi:hypothetical protein